MRVAIFMTGKGSDYCRENFGDYGELFRDLLQEPGTHFEIFDSEECQYPTDIAAYDAVIVTGSAADAHGDEAWIRRLEEGIRVARDANLKILGVCFGHQAVANALGGQSGRNPTGWECGIHELALAPAFHQLDYVKGIPLPLNILEIHQDHVIEPPPGAKVLASTPTTPVQMYSIGESILGIQGHPEFNNEILEELVAHRLETGAIPVEKGEPALRGLVNQPDRGPLCDLLKNFLYGHK